jgi:hemin uptake protein HemP
VPPAAEDAWVSEERKREESSMERRKNELEALVRTVAARELLGPRGLLRIEHQGELYTLRLTRNNRLILTK